MSYFYHGKSEAFPASDNGVPGKKAWVIVLTFIFMAGHDESSHIAEEIHSLHSEDFDVFSERRRLAQTAEISDVRVSPFRDRKPIEDSRNVKLNYSLEEHIDASRRAGTLGAPKKQLAVPYGVFPDLKFAFGIEYFCWHTVSGYSRIRQRLKSRDQEQTLKARLKSCPSRFYLATRTIVWTVKERPFRAALVGKSDADFKPRLIWMNA
jgi:hypothetical protein